MCAVLGGEDGAGVVVLLPGPGALPAQEGAVDVAGGVDGVHVIHNHLADFIRMATTFTLQSPQTLPWSTSGHMCSSHSPGECVAGLVLTWVQALADCVVGVVAKVVCAGFCGEDTTGILFLLPRPGAHPAHRRAVVGAGEVVRLHVVHEHLAVGAHQVMV